MIISNVSLSGNKTFKTASNIIREFFILKALQINIYPLNAPLIKEVLWQPLSLHWININTDGALIKNLAKASCGGILRDCNVSFLGGFAQNLVTASSFIAEITAAIIAVEIAVSKDWKKLLLEYFII